MKALSKESKGLFSVVPVPIGLERGMECPKCARMWKACYEASNQLKA